MIKYQIDIVKMPISRKPKQTPESQSNVEDFIQGGGSDPQETTLTQSKEVAYQALKLRIPADLLADIDKLVESRRPVPSRHQWILEALYEKVIREKEGDQQ